MYEDEQNEKKQLTIFSAIAFGMPVIMGLFMWYGYSQGKNIDLFSMTHMYYPAAGLAEETISFCLNLSLFAIYCRLS